MENSKKYEVLNIALSKITDENILRDFAENGREFHIRGEAISNIKNEKLLINFV